MSVVVLDPASLRPAVDQVQGLLDEVERACSRFRDDSELSRVRPGRDVRVSPMLADLVACALDVARTTDGLVDPTIGPSLAAWGYDRSLEDVRADGAAVSVVPRVPGWKTVTLREDRLSLPVGVGLDLGASAKARAADLAAERATDRTGGPVLVEIGGDIATAGDGPDEGWQVLVQDTDVDPACQVTLAPGSALATSSTVRRAWRRGGQPVHHILDPRTAAPARPVWRSVTVAGANCLEANAASTAAVVLGSRAAAWLTHRGCTARLVDSRGRVVHTGDWPAEVAA